MSDNTDRKTIYLCLAHMSDEGVEQKYVKEAFDTNWVVPLGPNVNAFEAALEEFVGEGKKVVALSAGTAAVHLALLACGVGPGDEVCVQSFTFCASSHPITYLGAKPVFIDSEKETWNMDPELLEAAIVDRKAKTGRYPKAIVPVALYGMPYQIDRIMAIADKYGIPVIEDAAEGFGSRFDGKVLGTFGKYGVLSFNGNKMITTSGGGALICSGSPYPASPRRGGDWRTADPTLYDLLKGYSEEMRNNPTEAESVAWSLLRGKNLDTKFRRQHIIGDYIVDFVCLEKQLVVEIDGEYHNEWEQQIDDAQRTVWLESKGFKVIRFTNAEVLAAPDAFVDKVKGTLEVLPTGEDLGGAETAAEAANKIMWYATQARDAYPYYEHTAIGYNYRMSNICAGIGRGQMTVANDHIRHHQHVQKLYEQLLADIPGITVHKQPADSRYDSNFWLVTATLDPNLKIKGQENAYKEVIKTAVGGAAGVIKAVESATTECQPNENVEALRVFMLEKKVECRPVWKPMHKQPVYCTGCYENDNRKVTSSAELNIMAASNENENKGALRPYENEKLGWRVWEGPHMAAYENGVSEDIFKVGVCLPAGPYVSDEDVKYIVQCIKDSIE